MASDPSLAVGAPTSARRPSDEATVIRPRESGRAGVVLGGLALVAVGGLAAFLLWPRTGQLKIDLKSKDGQPIPKAEIFVDGVKRCEAAPCVVSDLAPGAKTIRVIPPGQSFVDAIENVEAGKEKIVYISVGSSSAAGPAIGGTGLKVAGGQPGVKVFVDGAEKGGLPLSLTDLSPGDHKIKIDGGDRYQPDERTVSVVAGEVKDLGEIKLKVVKGVVTLDLRTVGASVVLSGTADGKKVEKKLPDSIWKSPPVRLPIDLKKEQWTLVATKKGLAELRRELDFADGNPEPTIVIELQPETAAAPPVAPTGPVGPGPAVPPKDPGKAPPDKDPGKEAATGQGTLNINSIPVSKVLLDGRPIGSTPKLGVSVSPGTHSVTFVKDGERKSVSVTVKAGETKVASVRF
jgi:serine/threonine-protein kinase